MTILHTERLRLEPFADAHVAGLNAMNSDPEVMRYLTGRPQTLDETRAMVERVKQAWATVGYAWWSLVDKASGDIVGAGCVQHLRHDVAALPDPACPLEIGWRLRRDRWHQGFASEAARAMAAFAFDTLAAPELLSVCDPENVASYTVMQRLGMRDQGLQSWYGREVRTYAITADEWRAKVARAAQG